MTDYFCLSCPMAPRSWGEDIVFPLWPPRGSWRGAAALSRGGTGRPDASARWGSGWLPRGLHRLSVPGLPVPRRSARARAPSGDRPPSARGPGCAVWPGLPAPSHRPAPPHRLCRVERHLSCFPDGVPAGDVGWTHSGTAARSAQGRGGPKGTTAPPLPTRAVRRDYGVTTARPPHSGRPSGPKGTQSDLGPPAGTEEGQRVTTAACSHGDRGGPRATTALPPPARRPSRTAAAR
ncbi:translation initiation factor IF-2-like [Meles meles]|uniref:translation initiation factor IF-2-like n=1 Tax=Meles meles TaxID=9662 RepID=UPI001E69CD0E|nr:translation initiation factor IF-2-like [Meles meles]